MLHWILVVGFRVRSLVTPEVLPRQLLFVLPLAAALAWRPQAVSSSWFQSRVFSHCSPSTATWSSSTTCSLVSTVCRWAHRFTLKLLERLSCAFLLTFNLFLSSNSRVPLFSSSVLSSIKKQGTLWNTAAAASDPITWSNPRPPWVPRNKRRENISFGLTPLGYVVRLMSYLEFLLKKKLKYGVSCC